MSIGRATAPRRTVQDAGSDLADSSPGPLSSSPCSWCSMFEEIAVGLLHHRAVVDSISGVGGGTLQQLDRDKLRHLPGAESRILHFARLAKWSESIIWFAYSSIHVLRARPPTMTPVVLSSCIFLLTLGGIVLGGLLRDALAKASPEQGLSGRRPARRRAYRHNRRACCRLIDCGREEFVRYPERASQADHGRRGSAR